MFFQHLSYEVQGPTAGNLPELGSLAVLANVCPHHEAMLRLGMPAIYMATMRTLGLAADMPLNEFTFRTPGPQPSAAELLAVVARLLPSVGSEPDALADALADAVADAVAPATEPSVGSEADAQDALAGADAAAVAPAAHPSVWSEAEALAEAETDEEL